MEDVLTEIPPPSRFNQDDINNFVPPSPPIPSPFLVLRDPKPLRPSLLILAVSSPSLHFFHHIPSKTLVGALVLPEIPFSGNSLAPSPRDKSCNIYALDSGSGSSLILVVVVQCRVAAERARAVSELLVGEGIVPERVVVFDSIQRHNFRARLSPDGDGALGFKLETSAERKAGVGGGGGGGVAVKGLDSFPSGSVVEGLSAALLSRCEMRNVKGTLCVTWPETGGPAVSLVKALVENVLPGVDLSLRDDGGNGFSWPDTAKDRLFDSDLYT